MQIHSCYFFCKRALSGLLGFSFMSVYMVMCHVNSVSLISTIRKGWCSYHTLPVGGFQHIFPVSFPTSLQSYIVMLLPLFVLGKFGASDAYISDVFTLLILHNLLFGEFDVVPMFSVMSFVLKGYLQTGPSEPNITGAQASPALNQEKNVPFSISSRLSLFPVILC